MLNKHVHQKLNSVIFTVVLGKVPRKLLLGLFCKSFWAPSKRRTEKRPQILTAGSIPACLVLQAGSRQAKLGWQSLGAVVKGKPSFLLGITYGKVVVYIHVGRSRCLSCLCVVLHLELQLHIQVHKTNSGSYWEDWVVSLGICSAPTPVLVLAQAFTWWCCQFLMRSDLGDHINICTGIRNRTGTVGGELDLTCQSCATLKWHRTGPANLEAQVLIFFPSFHLFLSESLPSSEFRICQRAVKQKGNSISRATSRVAAENYCLSGQPGWLQPWYW